MDINDLELLHDKDDEGDNENGTKKFISVFLFNTYLLKITNLTDYIN